jgi:cathepsin D
MATYEANTGQSHPLSGGIKPTRKRGSGGVQLTDVQNYMWYGTIYVGTPPEKFTGMTLSFC